MWAILAKDAAKLLPMYLECLLNQTYSKEDIFLYIRTNDNNDSTAEILKEFLNQHKEDFKGVFFDDSSLNPEIKGFKTHEWNEIRFNLLGKIRQDSVEFASDNNFEFYFVSDVDNFLMPDTLESLVSLNLQAVAPMLRMAIPEETVNKYENRNYSNFYFADENLGFKKTPEYYDILNGKLRGVHLVDLIHCTYLLRNDVYSKVDYLIVPGKWEYKNLIISLRNHGVRTYLDSRSDYGILTMSESVGYAKFQMSQLNYLDVNSSNLTETEKAFSTIYSKGEWGYRSGPGSNPESARPYINLINTTLLDPSIINILEIGCGDFRVGSKYKLAGKKYLGIDVNEPLIQEIKRYESDTIKFVHADFADEKFLGDWDLVLIKDVLQHLPIATIKVIVDKIIISSKNAIICNDGAKENFDIAVGGYRGINLLIDPFDYEFEKILGYGSKEVLRFSKN